MQHSKEKLSKLFVIFSIILCLSLVTVLANRVFSQQSSRNQYASAQPAVKLELLATIALPSSVAEGTTPAELNFTTQYEVSGYFNVTYPTITIEQGFLTMGIHGNVTDATVYDNLGLTYSPIINQTTITNPTISNIPVPSGSLYILTMNYTTENDVVFDNSTQEFQWGLAISGGEYPYLVSVNLPKDFSSIKVSQGANQTSEGAYNVITWNVQPYEISDCAVEFFPFTIQPTLTSMRITAQFMSNSVNTAIKMTFNESYNIQGSFLIWNVSLIMPVTIPFPANSSASIDVLSVSDGINECTEQPSPLALGTYLINFTNKDVEVLPRDTYQNNVSERFDVQVVFMVSNNVNNPEGIKANFSLFKPYESAVIVVYNVSNFGLFKPNFELFQMNIILPSGVDQVQSQTGTPMLEGSVDTGWTVIYNYVEPTDIPSSWIIIYEQPPLRSLFYQQVDTLILFALPFAFLIGLEIYKRKRKIKFVGLTIFSVSDGVVTGYLLLQVVNSWTTYQSLSGLNWFFTVLLAFEMLFAIIAIFLFVRPLVKKARSGQPSVENKTPNDEKPTNINHETNEEHNQKVNDAANTDSQNKTPTEQTPE